MITSVPHALFTFPKRLSAEFLRHARRFVIAELCQHCGKRSGNRCRCAPALNRSDHKNDPSQTPLCTVRVSNAIMNPTPSAESTESKFEDTSTTDDTRRTQISRSRVSLIMNRKTDTIAAKKLLDGMIAHSIPPDIFAFTAAMSVCTKGGRGNLALQIFGDLRRSGLVLNAQSYNAAIAACSKVKPSNWESALVLLREMEEKGIKPNVISYGAAISACENAKPSKL